MFLGAKPRHQAIGHVLGIIAGAVASVPVFYLVFLRDGPQNLITDHYRRAQRKPTVPIGDFDTAGDDDPAGDVEQKLEMERVNAAMAQLTPDQQEVLRLRFYGGLNSREAAEVLQKSDVAVRQIQHKGIQKLKQLLADKASGTTK